MDYERDIVEKELNKGVAMRLNQWITCLSVGLLATSSFANQGLVFEQLQVPQCLAAKITSSHTVLAENKQFKIIDLPSNQLDNLVLLADKVQCGRFINVSHKLSGSLLADKKHEALRLLREGPVKALQSLKPYAAVYQIKHEEEVNAALNEVVADNIWHTLTHLTSFYNRSASQNTGVDAANWLKNTFESMARQSNRDDTATFFVKTGKYKQPSLVTVIGKDIKAPAVVIGAHMDTLDGRMPGAGDDGSGSSSVMEMARVLLASNTTFKLRPNIFD